MHEFGQWGRVDTKIICTGIDFYGLKMAYPPHNTRTGKPLKMKDHNDIDCGGELEFCNEAKWKNAACTNGKVPGLNLINLPCSNTIIISAGCYKVLHIRSDNPGRWFIHCYNEVHSLNEMAMLITGGKDQIPKPPKEFPVCENFTQLSGYQYNRESGKAQN